MPGACQACPCTGECGSSALRSARLPVNLIGSPINCANRLMSSPITSQSTVQLYIRVSRLKCAGERSPLLGAGKAPGL